MKATKTSIGFRLPKPLAELLSEAAARRNLSPHVYARLLVTEALLDEKERLFLEELREVRQLLLQHDDHLKSVTVALLADAGKATVQEAEEFVRERLS